MRCFGAAPIRCHINKVGGIPPTTRVDNVRNLARRHFAAHGHHFFVGRALLVPHVCLNLACDAFLLHFHALRRLCAHASYQHSKESRFRLVWWKVGLVAPRYAGTETVTVQQPHSSPAPRIGKTSVGTTRRESAFRESLCETTVSVLACRRLPGSVLVLLHDMCEDDPRHFSP